MVILAPLFRQSTLLFIFLVHLKYFNKSCWHPAISNNLYIHLSN